MSFPSTELGFQNIGAAFRESSYDDDDDDDDDDVFLFGLLIKLPVSCLGNHHVGIISWERKFAAIMTKSSVPDRPTPYSASLTINGIGDMALCTIHVKKQLKIPATMIPPKG